MTTSSYKTKRVTTSSYAEVVVKILSNSNRFNIINLLLHTKEDLCVHELSKSVGISQSATSHQLTYLETLGVVKSDRTGRSKCYKPTNTDLTKKIAAVIKCLK